MALFGVGPVEKFNVILGSEIRETTQLDLRT